MEIRRGVLFVWATRTFTSTQVWIRFDNNLLACTSDITCRCLVYRHYIIHKHNHIRSRNWLPVMRTWVVCGIRVASLLRFCFVCRRSVSCVHHCLWIVHSSSPHQLSLNVYFILVVESPICLFISSWWRKYSCMMLRCWKICHEGFFPIGNKHEQKQINLKNILF